ncbi:Uncharacterised protein [Actinobacillus pleuropneumoniae]|nr:Uncharacterised protein [Actinobacillus pleuropneumoniae]
MIYPIAIKTISSKRHLNYFSLFSFSTLLLFEMPRQSFYSPFLPFEVVAAEVSHIQFAFVFDSIALSQTLEHQDRASTVTVRKHLGKKRFLPYRFCKDNIDSVVSVADNTSFSKTNVRYFLPC